MIVKRKTNINALVFALVMLLAFLLGTRGAFPVYAEDTELEFDKTDAVADLTGSEINGKTFNVADYAFDSKGKTTVLTFIEYSYAFREADQDNYGLYVYVYNPLAKPFIDDLSRNTIKLAFKENAEFAEDYHLYPLKLLNNSSGSTKGIFYKYKVVLTEKEKLSVLSLINSVERVYCVVDVHLAISGVDTVENITLGKTFKYTGYAAGCGFDKNDESTLKCKNEFLDVVSLECHATSCRPKGNNGTNEYTQDSLHSVYFTIPKKIVDFYGKLVGAYGRYLNAVLKPFLITGNQTAYDTFLPYLGQVVPSEMRNKLFYMGAFHNASVPDGSGPTEWHCGYSYNVNLSYLYNTRLGYRMNTLYMMFFSGSETDSADGYIVPSSTIAQALKEGATKFGGTLVQGKYPKSMFSEVDSEFTYFDVHTGDDRFIDTTHDLRNTIIEKSWWDKLWGLKGHSIDNKFEGLKAIEKVTDISGTAEEVADRYFISKSDYSDFCDMYNDNVRRNGDDMYILRYQVSDFISQEAALYEKKANPLVDEFRRVDTNAYFCQETVNLDFEIIDITMYKDSYHVIPVSMAPIDVIPEATPPLITNSDKTWWEQNRWLTWVLTGIAIIILLVVLMPILPTVFTVIIKLIGYIIKGIVWVVALPFRCIKLIIDKIKEKREIRK